MKIPSLILKRLYTFGSLENASTTPPMLAFQLKNRLSDAKLTAIHAISVNGEDIDANRITLVCNGEQLPAATVSADAPISFPLRAIAEVRIDGLTLSEGRHDIDIRVSAEPFGKLKFSVRDGLAGEVKRVRVPNDAEDDYGREAIETRRQFIEDTTGAEVEHLWKYSFDPQVTRGNIENFTGAAQVPLGFAGPITVHGEHAEGDFVVPLATTEGTLVASYNRGIKALNLSGGCTATVVDDAMQRAPVFVFHSAREARGFSRWVKDNFETIKAEAEATSSVAKLLRIEPYLAARFTFLRFAYATGDAAGQNMVGRATFAACSWILDNYPDIVKFYLESNLATDKKASQVNIMRTRGKRVVAEATLDREVLVQHMRVRPESLQYHSQVANIGAFLSGANNNGCHSPNAITAMFIATGQDVANVSESSAAIFYSEIDDNGNLYVSLTIPSLIVGTYGGGTGLPTQRESLEIMGCYGKGKVNKFAEIVAAVALAGEISLASAISSLDWVSSHEQYGRNR